MVILKCPPKEVFLYRNFQLGPGKVSVVRRCTQDFLRNQSVPEKVSARRRCPLQRMSAIEGFHCMVISQLQAPTSPGVLHLLSAQVPGFVPSELPGGCLEVARRSGLLSVIILKSQVVSSCGMEALFSSRLIYQSLLLSSHKICFKAGGKL